MGCKIQSCPLTILTNDMQLRVATLCYSVQFIMRHLTIKKA